MLVALTVLVCALFASDVIGGWTFGICLGFCCVEFIKHVVQAIIKEVKS